MPALGLGQLAVVERGEPQPGEDRGIFASVPDLITSIETYLEASNEDPRPYVWTATAEDILAKVQRARTKLDALVNKTETHH